MVTLVVMLKKSVNPRAYNYLVTAMLCWTLS